MEGFSRNAATATLRRCSLDKLAIPLTGGLVVRSVFAAMWQLAAGFVKDLYVDPEATPDIDSHKGSIVRGRLGQCHRVPLYTYIYIYIDINNEDRILTIYVYVLYLYIYIIMCIHRLCV